MQYLIGINISTNTISNHLLVHSKTKPEPNILLNLIDDLGNVATMMGYGIFGACIGSAILTTAPVSVPLIYFYYNQHHAHKSHLLTNKLMTFQ